MAASQNNEPCNLGFIGTRYLYCARARSKLHWSAEVTEGDLSFVVDLVGTKVDCRLICMF